MSMREVITGLSLQFCIGSSDIADLGIGARGGAICSFSVAGKTVFIGDHALKLESVPDWIEVVGNGYIGLEFSDVYTALGSEVNMPGFDPEIAKLAQKVLINLRKIDYRTGVFASKITPAKHGKLCLSSSFMPRQRSTKKPFRRAFIDELDVLQLIRNPNVVQFLDAVAQSNPKSVMECMSKANLIALEEHDSWAAINTSHQDGARSMSSPPTVQACQDD